MLNDFARSTPDRPSGFLSPDSLGRIDWVDLELGTSNGLPGAVRDAIYECRTNGNTVEYRKRGAPTWTPSLTVAGISPSISFTFDQLMRPVVTYQTGPGTNRVQRTGYLYWYDATMSGYQTLTVSNVISPTITFDYPSDASTSFSEMSWWYIRAGNVCYRRQADRFTIEYVFAAMPVNMRVIAMVGLGSNFRLHIQLER